MEPVEPLGPGATTPPRAATARRARRQRLLGVAAGLAGLPIVGSILLAPAIAYASGRADDLGRAAFVEEDPRSDGALVETYLGAGYSYADAVFLSDCWTGGDVAATKVKAGALLAHGATLADAPCSHPHAADDLGVDELVDAFEGNGYSAHDVAVLADHWGVDVRQAKAKAGAELKTVGVLPFVDPAVPPGTHADELAAFFRAGLDFDDARRLAAHWGLAGPGIAKVKAGAFLLDGRPLPAV